MARTARHLLLPLAVTLTIALAGCGEESPADRRASASPSSNGSSDGPADTATAETANAASDVVDVVVADLSQGPLPSTDALVDDTLLLDGEAIDLQLPDGALDPVLLGSYDGRLLLAAYAGGEDSQIYAVSDAGGTGAAEALGEPHPTYNNDPRLVSETGHVLMPYNDRGTVEETDTVLDASTGQVVGVYRNGQGEPALAPADRAVVEGWSGLAQPTPFAGTTSPDGSLRVVNQIGEDGLSATVKIRSTGRGHAVVRAFRLKDDAPTDVVFENDDAILLVVGAAPNGRRQVVVRCTTAGACELATEPAKQISLAAATTQ